MTKSRGFTLIEALVYLFILTILSVLVVNLLMSMLGSFNHLRLSRSLQESAVVTLDRLTREIKQARSVDLAGSDLGSHPGHLVLNTDDENGNPTTIEFYLGGGTMMIKEGVAAAASTTAPEVTVDNLVFERIATPISEAVRVQLTATASWGQTSRQAKFYATAVLRGSY